MNKSLQRGRMGEQIAEKYLERNGYRIKFKNWRCRWGEIDLIAVSPDGTLVFVEVKSKYSDLFGRPEEWVTPAKSRKLIRSAQEFLLENQVDDQPMRFDVIAVDLREKRISHIINALTLE